MAVAFYKLGESTANFTTDPSSSQLSNDNNSFAAWLIQKFEYCVTLFC
jgi:hypothetical protein